MQTKFTILNCLTASWLFCVLSSAVQAASFADPLDTAARMSNLAASTWLLDITHAGPRLVAVGSRGHIVYSDDNGATWKQSRVPVSVTLTAVSFPNPGQGWVVGHSGVILQSDDGGESWTRQLDGRDTPDQVDAFYQGLASQGDMNADRLRNELQINWEHGAEQPWLDVWFNTGQHGFVVGPFGLIMETHDGGRSWEPWMHRIDNVQALHLNGISEIAGALYIPSERGLIFRKEATEDSFSPIQTPYSGSFFGVCGDQGVLLAYGLRGKLYATLDRAGSWFEVKTGVATSLTSCVRVTNGHFMLAALSGQVIEVQREGDTMTSAPHGRGPWALNALTVLDGGVLGVGSGGVWLETETRQ